MGSVKREADWTSRRREGSLESAKKAFDERAALRGYRPVHINNNVAGVFDV